MDGIGRNPTTLWRFIIGVLGTCIVTFVPVAKLLLSEVPWEAKLVTGGPLFLGIVGGIVFATIFEEDTVLKTLFNGMGFAGLVVGITVVTQ